MPKKLNPLETTEEELERRKAEERVRKLYYDDLRKVLATAAGRRIVCHWLLHMGFGLHIPPSDASWLPIRNKALDYFHDILAADKTAAAMVLTRVMGADIPGVTEAPCQD